MNWWEWVENLIQDDPRIGSIELVFKKDKKVCLFIQNNKTIAIAMGNTMQEAVNTCTDRLIEGKWVR